MLAEANNGRLGMRLARGSINRLVKSERGDSQGGAVLVRAWVWCGAVMFYAFACLSLSWFSTGRQMVTAATMRATAKVDGASRWDYVWLPCRSVSQRVADPENSGSGSGSATSPEPRAARAD